MTINIPVVFHILIIVGACAAWLSAAILGSIVIARRTKFQQKYSPIPALTYTALGTLFTLSLIHI